MKSNSCSLRSRSSFLVPVLLAIGLAVPAAHAATSTPARTTAPASTPDSIAGAQEIPKSTFAIPRSPGEGRDPFFPGSTRLFAVPATKAVTTPVVAPKVELKLKGFSGPSNRRLAIINNRTFTVGESGEVQTSNSRVRVRCVQINNDSVTIEANGERSILRLRNGV